MASAAAARQTRFFSRRKLGAAAVVALLALAALLWALRWARGPQLEAVQLQAAPLVRSLQFSARVAALSRVDIGATITARVAQVLVDEGAQVRAGQALVQLEPQELAAGLAQALANERQADATLQAAQAAQTRAEQLLAQGFYSAAQLDETRRAEQVAAAQRGGARAAVVVAQTRLQQATLRAPADARVLVRQVEPGQIVQPGRALLSLALAGPTLLSAQVDERFLGQLQVGQSASVVADAFEGQRFAAQVQSIAPAVDAQRGAIEVKLAVRPPVPAYLREDMTLSVQVQTARLDSALVLPLSALTSLGDEATATAWVSANAQVEPRTVRLGLRTLDAVQVVDGLTAGNVVLLVGKSQKVALQAGQRVQAQLVPWRPDAPAPGPATAQNAGSALTNAMGR